MNACNVAGLHFLVVAAGRLSGEAHAAQVRNDHRVIACQVIGERHPHVAGLAIAVLERHGIRWIAKIVSRLKAVSTP